MAMISCGITRRVCSNLVLRQGDAGRFLLRTAPGLGNTGNASAAVFSRECRLMSTARPRPNWKRASVVHKDKASTQEAPPVVIEGYDSRPAKPPGGDWSNSIVPKTDASELVVTQALHDILDQPYLAVQRKLELGTVLIGFEQANHYTLYGAQGQHVGYMVEENSMAKTVVRNVTKTHRSFKATILDPNGNVLLKIDRPFYLVNNSLYVEDANGHRFGEIHQIFHVWRRKYDLYMNKEQFGRVDAPLLSWEFEIEDEKGAVMAAVDKHYAGLSTIVQTLFTDAHTYIVHLNPHSVDYDFSARSSYQSTVKPAEGTTPALNPGANTTEQAVAVSGQKPLGRRLTFEECGVVLGCAMAVDFDYFSRHSSGGMPLPLFIPMGGMGGGGAGEAAGGAAGAAGGIDGVAGGVGAGGAEGMAGEMGGQSVDGMNDGWGASNNDFETNDTAAGDTWNVEDPSLGSGSDLGDAASGAAEGGGSILKSIWDMFMDD